MSNVLNEITPLSEKDCLYIVERHKSEFTFPVHQHKEFELNYIENGAGVRRVVGDSVEEIGDFELTLITGEQLEHTWEQGRCTSPDIREITIQFSSDLFDAVMFGKNQFLSIQHMLQKAEHGLTFSLKAIMSVYPTLDTLSSETDRFAQLLSCLKILNELSKDPDSRVLASSSFAHADRDNESRRVQKIKKFVDEHYADDLSLELLAGMVGMTPTAFSRFFRQKTGRTLIDYIVDVRLGAAARLLVDTTSNVSEICYACGFNNLSNFNRLFKAKRGSTPRDFRTLYKKSRVMV